MLKWIPVFTSYSTMGGISVYVRYRRKRFRDFYEKELPDAYYIRYDDRELFITKPSCRDYEYQTFIRDYDYAINLDVFKGIYNINEIMITFIKKAFSIREKLFDKKNDSVTIYGDSGGYQLITGTIDFVNPIHVADYYNRYVNLGMPLDIPPVFEIDNDTLKRSAIIQRLNTIKMKSYLNDDVKLYNIVHGFNREQKEIYFDIVKDSPVDNSMIAIGGLYQGNPFDCLLNIFNTIEITKAEKFHIFGMSGAYLIPMFALVGMKYDVTTDSSEHTQYGIRMGFLSFVKGKMISFGIGNAYTKNSSKDMTVHSDSSFQNLSCSCDICNALGTNEIYFRSKLSTISHALISFHNLIILNKYVEVWNDIVNSMPRSYIFEMLNKTYPPKIRKSFIQCAKFIFDTLDGSILKSYKKYKPFFSDFAINGFTPELKIFNSITNESDSLKFYKSILEKYEKFHDGYDSNLKVKSQITTGLKPSKLNKKGYKSNLFSIRKKNIKRGKLND